MLKINLNYIRKMYFCYFWYFNSIKIIRLNIKKTNNYCKHYAITFLKHESVCNKYIKIYNNNNLFIYFIMFKHIPSQLLLNYYFEIFFKTIKYYTVLFNYYIKQKQIKLPLI